MTSKNRRVLDPGKPATQGKYTFLWVGSAGKEVVAGYLKFFSVTSSKFWEDRDPKQPKVLSECLKSHSDM